jgi:hypothetical protein
MPKPKQDDLGGMTGPGVEQPRHRDLDRLADKYDDLLENRAEISTSIGETEKQILDKMKEKGLTKYRYRDQVVEFKPGKDHIKIKTVKADSSGNGEAESEEKEQ